MKQHFIKKYMRLAKTIAEDNDSCYSRKIGVVVVDPETNGIVGTGYNGPPQDTPHCDSEEFLKEYFWPQLTEEEKEMLVVNAGGRVHREMGRKAPNLDDYKDYVNDHVNCKQCPRRLINAGSGERSELCSCQHAERNALNKLSVPAHGMVMFCWCGVPCIQCTGSIINAGISECHCLVAPLYHEASLWLFEKGKTRLIQHNQEKFEN